jgi:hypothetical protein
MEGGKSKSEFKKNTSLLYLLPVAYQGDWKLKPEVRNHDGGCVSAQRRRRTSEGKKLNAFLIF